MSSNAPVCRVSVSPPPAQATLPPLPPIPVAQPNMASIISVLNAMRQWMLALANAIPQNGAQGEQGPPGTPGKPPAKGQSTFSQVSLITEPITLTSEDGSVSFTFNQTKSIKYVDSQTGETLLINAQGVSSG